MGKWRWRTVLSSLLFPSALSRSHSRSRYFVFPSTYRWHRGSCAPASRKDLSVSCRASGATERTRSQPEYAGEDSAGTRSTDRNPEESKYLAVTHLYGCGRLSRKSLEEHLRGQIEKPRPLSGRFLRLRACCSAPCTDFVDRQARGKSLYSSDVDSAP